MESQKRAAFIIISETLGDYIKEDSRPHASPLRQCATKPSSINSIPRRFPLSVVDRYLTDRKWLDRHLKTEYRGHPVKMWCDMEQLFACDENWKRNGGLTRLGEVNYNVLVNTYGFEPTKLGGIVK